MSFLRHLPRFRQARDRMSQLAERETGSRNEIQSNQLRLLNDVWRHARTHVPHYRDLARDLNLPDRFDSIAAYQARMPILSKDTVRHHGSTLLSDIAEPGRWHRTGGSTGDPLRVFWSHRAHREMLWAKYRMEQSFGIDFLDRKAFLWGHDGSFSPGVRGRLQRWQQPMHDTIRRRLRLSAYRLGESELAGHLKRMAAFGPCSLYGYSSAIYVLAKHALETNAWPHTRGNLGLCVFTAEPADAMFLQTARDAFGCEATIEYGSVECGLIASGSPDGTLRVREDVVLVETVCDNDQDGRHDLIVTVLNNPSFPLLRYRIEDTTCSPIEHPETGFATLNCVLGRDNDVLQSRSGKTIHSMAIKHVLEADQRVRRFHVQQSSDGGLDVLVESNSPACDLDLSQFERHLLDLVDHFPVSIRVTDQIPGNLAGKHRWIVSERKSRNL